MKHAKIKVNGIEYQLQHPGVKNYFKKDKELKYVTTDGYFQFDKEKLFDYSFGIDGGASRIVYAPDGLWVDWGKAEFEPDLKKYIPSIVELEEIWAIILPGFFNGRYADPSEDADNKWEWIEKHNDKIPLVGANKGGTK